MKMLLSTNNNIVYNPFIILFFAGAKVIYFFNPPNFREVSFRFCFDMAVFVRSISDVLIFISER